MAQTTIDFLISNNIAIIQGVFAIIFILVVFVILRSFKADKADHTPPRPSSLKERRDEARFEKAPETSTPKTSQSPAIPQEGSPLDDLDNLDDLMGTDKEATEAKIDQTLSEPPAQEVNLPPPPDFVEAAKGASSGELEKALNEKEKIISDLKEEIKNLQKKAPAEGSDTAAFEAKIKELTEKLSEYEIIEDDIANLSFYKTENTKLKNELEKLKGASSTTTDAAVNTLNVETTPQPVVPEPVPVVESAPPEPVPVLQAEPAPSPTPSPAPASASEQVDDNSILNEFEEAVRQKEALEKNLPPPPPPAPGDADLLKEFESAVEKELASPAPTTSSASAPASQSISDINSEKLVQEAEELATTAPPVTPDDDNKNSNQKLIEEFENFVNKT